MAMNKAKLAAKRAAKKAKRKGKSYDAPPKYIKVRASKPEIQDTETLVL